MSSNRFALCAVAALWALSSAPMTSAQTASSAPAAAPAAPAGPPRPDLNTKVRGFVRSFDVSTFPADKFATQFVAGPSSGLDSAIIGLSHVPPQGNGPGLHIHSVDQIYFILKGEMSLQLGTETFTTGANSLVLIPAGTPHRNWNPSSQEEMHLELIVPAPVDALVQPAQPRAIANAAALIRTVAKTPRATDTSTGLRSWWLGRRETGSAHMAIRYDEADAKAGDAGLHIHTFDQVYFMIDGTMNLQVGTKTFEVKPNSYVVIPAGTVHKQWNGGQGVAKYVTLMMSEPAKGEPLDIPVEMKAQSSR